MKHRTMVVAFNAVIGFSFVFLFILPIILFGPEYAAAWGFAALPACAGFGLVLVTVNLVLRSNGIMYARIEARDWKGLADWLEPRIVLRSGTISRNPLSQPRVKLYVDACLLLGDYGRVEKLERQLAASGSPLLESQALSFGLSRFVRNHVDEAADFFESWLDNKKTENRDWLRFAFGFCRLLQGRFKESLPWFSGAARSDDAVLASAAAYLLSTISPLVAESDETPGKSGFAEKHNEDESLKLAGETRKRLLQAFPGKKLDEEFSRASGEMHVAFFGKILDDAKAWVTGGEGNEAIVHEKEINNIGFHAENVNR